MSTPLPTPLTADQCPLLRKHGGAETEQLLSEYNLAVAELHQLSSDRVLARLLTSERFRGDVVSILDKVRGLLTRTRYVVGCIGITQAGKSTTINNVLGEEVCKPGVGDATSSQPSRIIYDPTPSLEVEYLDPERYRLRRQALCERINLPNPPEEAELLQILDRPNALLPNNAPEPPRFHHDLAYLKAFVRAYQTHHRVVVKSPPLTQTNLPYEDRYRYTTHAQGNQDDRVLLVREARFRIPNERLPRDLELCDLPGLDSKRSIDDIVTWEYLPELNGTFLFVSAGGNLLTQGMLEILSRLKQEFQNRLAGRAWVIFNRMDALSNNHFRTDRDENIFHTIDRLLQSCGIPESQAVFCSKKIYDLAVSHGGTAPPDQAARFMSQPADQPVPSSCPEGLRRAWSELIKDGGISYLRELMFRQVPGTLAQEIQDQVRRTLSGFRETLARRVDAERRRLTLDCTQIQAVNTCRTAVSALRVQLADRPCEFPILVQETARLRQSLTTRFEQDTPRELVEHLSPREVARQFRTQGHLLGELLRHELMAEVVGRVYQAIGQSLERLPRVELGPERLTCHDLWQRFGREDATTDGWLQHRLPRFADDHIARWMERSGSIPADTYIGLLRDKITVVVQQTMGLLRSRLRQRLALIVNELLLLTPEAESALAY